MCMDSDNLHKQIKARLDHQQAKHMLKEKYQAKMIFAYNGGMFCAGPELQMLLASCNSEQAVVLDLYDTPTQVNVAELATVSRERWQEQMNAWLCEWKELQQQR